MELGISDRLLYLGSHLPAIALYLLAAIASNNRAQRSVPEFAPGFRRLAAHGRFHLVRLIVLHRSGRNLQFRVLLMAIGAISKRLVLGDRLSGTVWALAIDVAAILPEAQLFLLLRCSRPHE